ncbi:MAG: metallophosphoesterase [Anaerolineae bacterium]|nr:metallophosphatase family protein [Thermoflexales bacterium]MDW8406672.1 metallophosphoesterase [Anaerolineae bacterium]
MKIAVLSDVHANLPALEAVAEHVERWRPDQVIVAGDLVNRGPRSPECLRFVQHRAAATGWQMLLGNHEEYVLYHTRPDAARSGPAFELRRASYFTFCQLGGDVRALADLPFSISLDAPDHHEARFTHASMRGTRDGMYRRSSDAELLEQIGPPRCDNRLPAVFCVGHTHMPFIRLVNQTLVVNAGSVGMPFDGDTRASYAQLVWRGDHWQAEIIRLTYDLARADQDFEETGFLEQGGPLARLMRIELRTARSQLYQWGQRFEALVLAGVMTMEESVEEFLGM